MSGVVSERPETENNMHKNYSITLRIIPVPVNNTVDFYLTKKEEPW
jgi:hypothetical protein